MGLTFEAGLFHNTLFNIPGRIYVVFLFQGSRLRYVFFSRFMNSGAAFEFMTKFTSNLNLRASICTGWGLFLPVY